MQSNTAEIRNRPVSFSTSSVEKRCESDPFTVRDGRYVGSDGFVVPKNSEEFYDRFPDYVSKWVSKHTGCSVSKEDLEDRTQDLLMHVLSLPQVSKYRKAGKKDIVQTFDPSKHFGANEARFRNYVNLCLANKSRTIRTRELKDALRHSANVSLGGPLEDEDPYSVDDEYCYSHSACLRRATSAAVKQAHEKAFVREFMDFVRREDRKALLAVEAILVTGTQGEAGDWLGITEREFGRMRKRLGQLAKCFLSGEPVPRQGRSYKRRLVEAE